MNLMIKFANIEKLIDDLNVIPKHILSVLQSPSLHRRLAALLIADARRNIDEGGRPEKFVPLADATRLKRLQKQFAKRGGILTSDKKKTRKGVIEAARTMKILRDTSNLYSEMNYDSSQGNTFFLGVVDYLKYHQSDEPRRKLPQRKVFNPIQSTFDEMEKTVGDYLMRRFSGGEA